MHILFNLVYFVGPNFIALCVAHINFFANLVMLRASSGSGNSPNSAGGTILDAGNPRTSVLHLTLLLLFPQDASFRASLNFFFLVSSELVNSFSNSDFIINKFFIFCLPFQTSTFKVFSVLLYLREPYL